jgi:FKBP-type peptidyl-prolyl cis-trans isomerase 2
MAEPGPSRILLVLLVVVILIAAGVGILAANYFLHPKAASGYATVQVGDNVTVDYIGMFGSGPEIGRTFDTSVFSAYLNNITYPKSAYFAIGHSGNPANYTPLGVHVGGSGQFTIGNTTFRPVVTGFWEGMLGMAGNQTRFIVVPPALGYGSINPACTLTLPLSVTVPVLVTVPVSKFSTFFPGVSASSGTIFTDPLYGWSDMVLSVNATSVTVEHLPAMGETTQAGAWNITVTNLTATRISVLNDLTPSNYAHLLGTFPTASTGACAGQTHYLVSGVDLAKGTYTVNWNSEVTGQTLIFRVTTIDLFG